jgi:RimJ/RimL family protein N-acetyltransferase
MSQQHHCQGDIDEFLSALVSVPEVLELDGRARQRAERRDRVAARAVGGLTIRPATHADIPPMVELGRHFLRQSPYAKHLAESPEQMTKLGEFLLGGAGGMLCAERGGKIVGMLGYVIHDHFISGEKSAGEVFWWVEPEHRGDGLRLLVRFEAVARAAGAKKLQMIAPDERVAALYARLGYHYLETSFQKAL